MSDATERLKAEFHGYLAAQAERVLVRAGRALGRSTVVLRDIADGRSTGFAQLALESGRKITQGKGLVRRAVEIGASRLKERVITYDASPTVVIESVDVPVSPRLAYDRWAELHGKGDAGDSDGDGPEYRIARSTGDEAACAVTFHAMADDLTRVLLVAEYPSNNLTARAAGLWRTRARRARRDLRDFARDLSIERSSR